MPRSARRGTRTARFWVISAIASSGAACSLSMSGTGDPVLYAGDGSIEGSDDVGTDVTGPPGDATSDLGAPLDGPYAPDARDARADGAPDAPPADAPKDSPPPDTGLDAAKDGDAACTVACPCTTEVTCPNANDVCLGLVCVACGASGSQNFSCHGGGKCHEVQAVCM